MTQVPHIWTSSVFFSPNKWAVWMKLCIISTFALMCSLASESRLQQEGCQFPLRQMAAVRTLLSLSALIWPPLFISAITSVDFTSSSSSSSSPPLSSPPPPVCKLNELSQISWLNMWPRHQTGWFNSNNWFFNWKVWRNIMTTSENRDLESQLGNLFEFWI